MVLLPVSRKRIHPKGQKQIKHGGKTIFTQLNFIEITFLYEYYYDPEILFQEYLQVGNS